MKVIINGAGGAMGKNVQAVVTSGVYDTEAFALVDKFYKGELADNQYTSLYDIKGDADIVIDFSHHSGTAELLEFCTAKKLPVVIATTGHTDDELELIKKASEQTAVFKTTNFSVGVAVLCDLVKKAAAAFPDADVEIIERHHNRKVDAPSGTALTIAENIQEVRENSKLVMGRSGSSCKREPGDIGIHAVRYGNEVGTHEIIISTGYETITLKHEAEDRKLFADGAVKAAVYLCGKPAGMYGMKELLAE
ncbi:MAG: 4-hydroxy-tetrahydrodipicolinate reductase [Eubacteriales bacterium]|nr:4-hydroxy-tetrahydrodipicolinate reductase [Eubacteriales bacterium]